MVELKKRYFIALGITIVLLCLTHHCWLGHKSSTHFDCLLFIIVLILGYLFSLKLTSYIADFKSIKNQSRIDIIFLSVFFILLFLPISHIDQSKISQTENKTLAKYPHMITKKGKLNLEFGKKFDEWFNDRFYLRNAIVKYYIQTKYKITYKIYSKNDYFCNKKTNWMGSFKNPSYAHYYNNKKELESIILGANTIQNFCNNNNIKLYILIAPVKSTIYQDKLYPIIKISDEAEITNKIILAIKKQNNINIVYPYNEIKNYSLKNKELTYFKSDHHWTDSGAYIAYVELMKLIKKDFPNIYINKPSDFNYFYNNEIRVSSEKPFHNGRTYEKLFIGDSNTKVLDTEYKYFSHKNTSKLNFNEEKLKWNYFIVKHYKYINNANNKIFLFGDSMGENLLQMIPFSFKNTDRINNWNPELLTSNKKNTETVKQYILKSQPDILVICFRDIHRLEYLKYFNNKEK